MKGQQWGIIIVIVVLAGVVIMMRTKNNSSSTEGVIPTQTKKMVEQSKNKIREFSMVAKQFEFQPATITVKEGETVRLKIKSIDVEHGLALPDFKVEINLFPGKEETVEFVADKKGTFTFFCSVMCGSGHRDMKGTLIVE